MNADDLKAADPRTLAGLLLVGHGTRDPRGRAEFEATAAGLARRLPGTPLEACYLELAEPTIDEGVDRLVAAGVRRIVATPVLLFAGGHARVDIPAAVAAAVARHPGTLAVQAGHLGCQPPLLELSAERFVAAVPVGDDAERSGGFGGRGDAGGEPPLLVMIGRGGGDPEALDEMRQFVALRRRRTRDAGALIGFLAGPGPLLDETLDAALAWPAASVLVQPHLLFQGRLTEQVRAAVRARAVRDPRRVWRLAAHLGPADEVIATLADNYSACVDIATFIDSAYHQPPSKGADSSAS